MPQACQKRRWQNTTAGLTAEARRVSRALKNTAHKSAPRLSACGGFLNIKQTKHMALDSKIEWTHHTANLWWGCTNVHEGCDNCYAEAWANRYGVKWGNDAPRKEVKSVWGNLLGMQAKAATDGHRKTRRRHQPAHHHLVRHRVGASRIQSVVGKFQTI